ncbi:hypothetical protein [Aliikangiella sp. IMCC44359]|uniref:hypothetical protein n=1 Tax=Aliikangiella sp. IMCC44359 TaxID=3459125 RepID=UPI00403AC53A
MKLLKRLALILLFNCIYSTSAQSINFTGGWKGEILGDAFEVVIWQTEAIYNNSRQKYYGVMYLSKYDCLMIFHLDYQENGETQGYFNTERKNNPKAANCKKNTKRKDGFQASFKAQSPINKDSITLFTERMVYKDKKYRDPNRIRFKINRGLVSESMYDYINSFTWRGTVMTPPFDIIEILKNTKKIDSNDLLTIQTKPENFKLDNPNGYFTVSNSAVHRIEVTSNTALKNYTLRFYQVVSVQPFARNGSLVGIGVWDPKKQKLSFQDAKHVDGCGVTVTKPINFEFSGVNIKGLSHPSLSGTTSDPSCALSYIRNCSYHSCRIWSDDPRFGKFKPAYYIIKSKRAALKIYSLVDKPKKDAFDDIKTKIY